MINRSEHTGIGDRNSTRVHAAPGGNTTLDLFGGYAKSTPDNIDDRKAKLMERRHRKTFALQDNTNSF